MKVMKVVGVEVFFLDGTGQTISSQFSAADCKVGEHGELIVQDIRRHTYAAGIWRCFRRIAESCD